MFLFLLLAFVCIPLVEIALLVRIAQAITLGPTIALVLLTGVAGAALARHEGARTLSHIQQTLARGELPAQAMVEGVLIFVAGVLLVTPGVITDAFGILMLIPPVRRLAARRLRAYFGKRMIVMGQGFHPMGGGFDVGGYSERADADDDIIDVPYREVTERRLNDQ